MSSFPEKKKINPRHSPKNPRTSSKLPAAGRHENPEQTYPNTDNFPSAPTSGRGFRNPSGKPASVPGNTKNIPPGNSFSRVRCHARHSVASPVSNTTGGGFNHSRIASNKVGHPSGRSKTAPANARIASSPASAKLPPPPPVPSPTNHDNRNNPRTAAPFADGTASSSNGFGRRINSSPSAGVK